MRGAAVMALLALMAAARAAPASPACGLLSPEETAAMVGATATIADGGPVMSGVASCAWSGAGNLPVVTVQVLGAASFGSAGVEAADYYDRLIAGMTSAGETGEVVTGIGERAYLVTASESFTLTALKGDKILTVTALGLAREAVLAAATTLAGRV